MPANTNTDVWVAGAVAAFTVDLAIYPLDTIKTRWQSPKYNQLFLNNRPALFRGLYQGIAPVILATVPSSGAFFTTYEGTKSVLTSANASGIIPTPIIHATSSGLAELVSCAILTPAEVIKQNAQMVDSTSGSKAASAVRQTFEKFRNNPLQLWRGYTALAGRNLPFTALQFPMFERLKAYLKKRQADKAHGGKEREVSLLETVVVTTIAAGSAGSVSAVVTTPIDVIKTRIMLTAGDEKGKSGNQKKQQVQKLKEGKVLDALGEHREQARRHKGAIQIAKEVIAEQGWKGLFRGGALRAIWVFGGSGLYIGTYEGGRLYLERRRARLEADER